MSTELVQEVGDAERIALGYTPLSHRAMLATFFAFDRRLGKLLARTAEPTLGQLRLAWWREALNKPVALRAKGDLVLDSISQHWAGKELLLLPLIDCWETFAVSEELSSDILHFFAFNRSKPLLSLFEFSKQGDKARAESAAFRWALADAAAHVSDEGERMQIVAVARSRTSSGGSIPRFARGLAVLDALSTRALARGGLPLMQGRGVALVALRAGMFGR